jgi:hypothetical protein
MSRLHCAGSGVYVTLCLLHQGCCLAALLSVGKGRTATITPTHHLSSYADGTGRQVLCMQPQPWTTPHSILNNYPQYTTLCAVMLPVAQSAVLGVLLCWAP